MTDKKKSGQGARHVLSLLTMIFTIPKDKKQRRRKERYRRVMIHWVNPVK